MSIPIKSQVNNDNESFLLYNDSDGEYEFFYSTSSMEFLKSNDVQDMVEDIIINNLIEDNDKTSTNDEIGITDYANKIFIQLVKLQIHQNILID